MNEHLQLGHNRKEYSVSEISVLLKRTIELNFSSITIKGEISGLKIASSGHIYFSLKDQQSVLSSVCWKGLGNKLSIRLEEGLEVVCTGTITTFSGQSKYQLIVEEVELAGLGSLMVLLEKRKKQLEAEGLFDIKRKKKLPFLPNRIGVITSITGAVIKDMLHRINDRCPTKVIIWPVLVQGENAAIQIVNAIKGFNSLQDNALIPDVIIVARGGGSIEDLWPFNEEIVVRATANSRIPIVSAIGHETDTTLIDFASDLRAPTPTAAAEFVVPVLQELYLKIYDNNRALYNLVFHSILNKQNYLQALKHGLISPNSQLFNLVQKTDDLSFRLVSCLPRFFKIKMQMLKEISTSLSQPLQQIIYLRQSLAEFSTKLNFHYMNYIADKKHFLNLLINSLTIQSFLNNMKFQEILVQNIYQKLTNYIQNILQSNSQKIDHVFSLVNCYSYQKTLERGYVIMMTPDNQIIDQKLKFEESKQIKVLFKDGKTEFNK